MLLWLVLVALLAVGGFLLYRNRKLPTGAAHQTVSRRERSIRSTVDSAELLPPNEPSLDRGEDGDFGFEFAIASQPEGIPELNEQEADGPEGTFPSPGTFTSGEMLPPVPPAEREVVVPVSPGGEAGIPRTWLRPASQPAVPAPPPAPDRPESADGTFVSDLVDRVLSDTQNLPQPSLAVSADPSGTAMLAGSEAIRVEASIPAISSSAIPLTMITPVPAAELSAPSDPGTLTSDRYDISGLVDSNELGDLYQAYDNQRDRNVLLRVLPERTEASSETYLRLKAQVKGISRLSHPNIVATYDFGRLGDRLYVAREERPTTRLSDLLNEAEGGVLAPERVYRFADDILSGLAYAHGRGVLHRDIRAETVVIGDDGVARLCDFGLARALDFDKLRAGVAWAAHIAPEEQHGASIDQRADLYSVGALLYTTLAGTPPIERAGDSPQPLRALRTEVPEETAQLIHMALAPDRDERPRNAAFLRRALQAHRRALRIQELDQSEAGRELSDLPEGVVLGMLATDEDGTARDTEAREALFQAALWDDRPAVRTAALEHFPLNRFLNDPHLLRRFLLDPEPSVREAALGHALRGDLGAFVEAFREFLLATDMPLEGRRQLYKSIGRLASVDALPAFACVVYYLNTALAGLGGPAVPEELVQEAIALDTTLGSFGGGKVRKLRKVLSGAFGHLLTLHAPSDSGSAPDAVVPVPDSDAPVEPPVDARPAIEIVLPADEVGPDAEAVPSGDADAVPSADAAPGADAAPDADAVLDADVGSAAEAGLDAAPDAESAGSEEAVLSASRAPLADAELLDGDAEPELGEELAARATLESLPELQDELIRVAATNEVEAGIEAALDGLLGDGTLRDAIEADGASVPEADEEGTPPHDVSAPSVLPDDPDGRYVLATRVGSTGPVDVYVANDTVAHEAVTMRLFRALPEDADSVEFWRNLRTVASLRHEGIVAFAGFGELEGRPFLCEAWVTGRTLDEELSEFPEGLPLKRALGSAMELASALAYTHDQGLVHGDLQPANVMLAERKCLLTNFDLTRAYGQETPIGHPSYLSPEQLAGGPVDVRTDVFAFGVILYKMLSGKLPFEGTLRDEVPSSIRRHREAVPQVLDSIIRRCVDPDPETRLDSLEYMSPQLANVAERLEDHWSRSTPSAPQWAVAGPASKPWGSSLALAASAPKLPELDSSLMSPLLPDDEFAPDFMEATRDFEEATREYQEATEEYQDALYSVLEDQLDDEELAAFVAALARGDFQ